MGLIPLLVNRPVPEAEIGAQVHHPHPGRQKGRHHLHGGLVGHRQEDHLGLGHVFRPGVDEGKIDDAGQGRKDLQGTALVFPGGEGHQFAAGVPGQKAHEFQPGVPGGPVNRHFNPFHKRPHAKTQRRKERRKNYCGAKRAKGEKGMGSRIYLFPFSPFPLLTL